MSSSDNWGIPATSIRKVERQGSSVTTTLLDRFIRLIVIIIVSFTPLIVNALEGQKMLGPTEIQTGDSFRYDDLNFQSLELRWKLPNLQQISKGENLLFEIDLFEAPDSTVSSSDTLHNPCYTLKAVLLFDGTSYSFNDEKFENLKVILSLKNRTDADEASEFQVELSNVNSLKFSTIKVEVKDGLLSVLAGNKEYQLFYRGSCAARINGVTLQAEKHLEVSSVFLSQSDKASGIVQTDVTASELEAKLQNVNAQSLEGVYRYLDSDLNDKRVTKGGDYTLYLRTAGNGIYELIYLDGAKANSGAWKEGMIKGRLLPTRFDNHYNVEWYDAQMANDFEELWADFTAGPILTIHFPIEKSQLRFYRVTNF